MTTDVALTNGPGLEVELDEVRLDQLVEMVETATEFEGMLPDLERELLGVLDAERLLLFQKLPADDCLVSRFSGTSGAEVRLPLDNSSIPGYVATTADAVRLEEVYDPAALSEVYPGLMYEVRLDRQAGFPTESVLVLPVVHDGEVAGVVRISDKRGGGPFTAEDQDAAEAVVAAMTSRFFYELKAECGPFDPLVAQGTVSLSTLHHLKARASNSDSSLAWLLVTDGGVPRAAIKACLEEHYELPFLGYDEAREPDRSIVDRLRADFLKANCWVPFSGGSDDETIILVDDPHDTERLSEIQSFLGIMDYELRVGIREDIYRYLGFEVEAPRHEGEAIDAELEDISTQKQAAAGGNELAQLDGGEGDDDSAAVIKFVNRMITEAVEEGASDIHVNPGKDDAPGMVRMRIDGVCQERQTIPAGVYSNVVTRIKIMANMDIAERRKPLDGKIAVTLKRKRLELRVATVPTVHGETAVLRILASGEPLPFDKLNFSTENQRAVELALDKPHGLVLVVGPTGSGKTTTLHALLGKLNTPERNIVTAEDPVEITQPGLQQVQINRKAGLDFAIALRAFLRADPDVILIGEMRDAETAQVGVESSLTGHLVFSTLHTNSAPETVIRLLDMGLDPLNFADALVVVVAQRLVRTICKQCKQTTRPSRDEVQRLMHVYGEDRWQELDLNPDRMRLYRGKGCARCGKTGYRGRTGIHEVLVATPEMKQLISGNSTVSEIAALAVKQGMRTLTQDGALKVIKGDTDLEQLRRVTVV